MDIQLAHDSSGLTKEARTSFFLTISFSFSRGNRSLPRPNGCVIPPACSGSAQWSRPSWTCDVSSRNLKQMLEPTRLTSYDAEEGQLSSELLPDVWAPHPIAFAHFCLWSNSFGHFLKFMATGESCNRDQLINIERFCNLYGANNLSHSE